MKLVGKLICWVTRKHKRGKLVRVNEDKSRVIACPRCGAVSTYRKARNAAV